MMEKHFAFFFLSLFTVLVNGCKSPNETENKTGKVKVGLQTIIREDPCQFDMRNRIKTVLSQSSDFNSDSVSLYRFSFDCQELERLKSFDECIAERFSRDRVSLKRIWVETVEDSLYRLQWYQLMGNDGNAYCEQLHYMNYMAQKYTLSEYSNLRGTIVINP